MLWKWGVCVVERGGCVAEMGSMYQLQKWGVCVAEIGGTTTSSRSLSGDIM